MSADTSDSGNLPAPESAADLAGADSPGSERPEATTGPISETQSKPAGSLISVAEPKNSIDRIPVVGFLWHLYRGYSRRNGPLLSAGIAYYALFSIGPLALLTINIAGRLFETEEQLAVNQLANVLDDYLGEEMAALLASAITQVTSPQGYTFAIVGLGILLYGATRLFVRLQASFNIMWDIRIVSRTFSVRRLLSRLLVFGMILIPTIVLVLALVLTAAFSWLSAIMGGSGVLITVAQVAVPFVISWLALLTIFVVLPDMKLSWRDCWFTTLLVAVAWAVATHIFGRYLSWSGSARYAGAVGAVVGLIFWVDIMAIITLVGVRFNKAIYLWRGKVIQPYEYAAPVTETPDVESAAAGAAGASSASSATDISSATASADGKPEATTERDRSETPPGTA